jgi:hypothetical protein
MLEKQINNNKQPTVILPWKRERQRDRETDRDREHQKAADQQY